MFDLSFEEATLSCVSIAVDQSEVIARKTKDTSITHVNILLEHATHLFNTVAVVTAYG